MMVYLQLKLLLLSFMVYGKGLMNLDRLSAEDIDFSSWWIILAEKIIFLGSIELVEDMSKEKKRIFSKNNLSFKLHLLSLLSTCSLIISPIVQVFA